jgi:AraC family transcriptional regulator
MNECIKKSLYYIETHLDEPFDLDDLAKIAGYSKYHFSRIFKLHVGESIIEYITRLKLEKAQLKVMHKNLIIDVALDVGFETPNGFNKAFKKIFGTSPTEYKKIKSDFLKNFKGKLMQEPKIVTLEEKFVVFTRESGEYNTSSKIAWERLSNSLNGLEEKIKKGDETFFQKIKDGFTIELDPKKGELLGICHDDPTVTQSQNIRYDASIAWEKDKIDFLKRYGYETKTIEGGQYAMTTYYGRSDENLDSWLGLYGWCVENGYNFRDTPPFEKYVNMIENIDNPDKQITEIYIPIKA